MGQEGLSHLTLEEPENDVRHHRHISPDDPDKGKHQMSRGKRGDIRMRGAKDLIAKRKMIQLKLLNLQAVIFSTP